MTHRLDIQKIRSEFPILHQTVHHHPLVYLDSGNTTQKPQSVIQAIDAYYQKDNANIHRAVYALSERATKLFEDTRDAVQKFIHAAHRHEIIFVKGTTEAINLVADTFTRCHIQVGDEIILSEMEHHSNIVPWQMACTRMGAVLKIIPVLENGELDMACYERLLTPRTRLVAVTHISNVLGTINPVEKIIALAHGQPTPVPVLLDGAQAAPHMPVDVQALDCDFYVFSAHKMYGPTGVGVLYGKEKWLEKMPPYQGGGSMIREVTFAKTTYNELPYKFEAGTAPIAGVVGLGAAIHYMENIGLDNIAAYEDSLLKKATAALQAIPGLDIIGTAEKKAAVISCVMKGIHPHDVGTILDTYGVAVRVGHHCAMPLMARFQVPATIRISFGLYNTLEEIDVLVDALHKTKRLLG
jgi:cysteine desulfurase/selenocysteine lyase